jgi:hypothetical protein
MPEMMYHLPDGVVYAKPGQFLMGRSAEDNYRLYQVQGLYLISRLLPIEPTQGGGEPLGFLLQSSVAASAGEEIRYLVTEFSKIFPSKKSAIESISQHTLGPAIADQCLDVRQFTSLRFEVYPR